MTDPTSIHFTNGHGFGHGVGMCQSVRPGPGPPGHFPRADRPRRLPRRKLVKAYWIPTPDPLPLRHWRDPDDLLNSGNLAGSRRPTKPSARMPSWPVTIPTRPAGPAGICRSWPAARPRGPRHAGRVRGRITPCFEGTRRPSSGFWLRRSPPSPCCSDCSCPAGLRRCTDTVTPAASRWRRRWIRPSPTSAGPPPTRSGPPPLRRILRPRGRPPLPLDRAQEELAAAKDRLKQGEADLPKIREDHDRAARERDEKRAAFDPVRQRYEAARPITRRPETRRSPPLQQNSEPTAPPRRTPTAPARTLRRPKTSRRRHRADRRLPRTEQAAKAADERVQSLRQKSP